MFHIAPLDDKTWNSFQETLNLNTFLHTLGWVDFHDSFGHKTWKLGLYNGKKLTSVVFVFKIKAKRGTFLFCPHGPQMLTPNLDEISHWFLHLKELASSEKCTFIRVAPILENSHQNTELFSQLGFHDSPIHMHAELTTVLDLTQNLDTLLLGMRKTTRQLINKGEKMIQENTITIKSYTKISDEMWEVYSSTAKRGGFVPFSREYLAQEYKSFSRFNKCKMIGVYYEGKLLSWGLWIISGKRCFYHQGANILDKTIPASYISHYQGIEWAKRQGAISYDFWGVGPKDDPTHPWGTISSFKRGFGGQDQALVHAQDYPLSWKYWITWAFETYRAKKRGF
jgi:lipid II:glycine glycyltransferase (peptidoglycan interpeptide bridge formation enzyme)